MSDLQVSAEHYAFLRYMSKERWISIWHQVNELQRIYGGKTLEVGAGSGLFKIVAAKAGLIVETLDVDPELAPDHIGSITEIPFDDGHFATTCAFQVLEHLPYEQSLVAFSELVRTASEHVLISLPDAQRVWRFQLHIPWVGPVEWLIPRPFARPVRHAFDGEHYWELNKLGYRVDKVTDDLVSLNVELLKTFRVPENPYHRFFLFKKRDEV